MPAEYSSPRQWILNFGQEGTGANHWIWQGSFIQFGTWNGQQIRDVDITQCTSLTTTFDGESTLKLYCNGELVDHIDNSSFNINSSQIHIGGNQRFEAPSGDFKGCIHEVELWPSELRADQVASLVYDAHAYSQCYSNSAPYPGDRLDNPIFGSGGFAGSMTGAQCAERCNDPTNTDAYGRRCVAYEHSSQNHEDVANCAFAWACDYTGYWAGGAVYVRRSTATTAIPSTSPSHNTLSSSPTTDLPSVDPSAALENLLFSANGSCLHEVRDIRAVIARGAHTIHVKLDMPAEYSSPRQWILNFGQEGTGANHWIWQGSFIQFGTWNGQQIRDVDITQCTSLTTTFDGESTLKLYCNGELVDHIDNSSFNINSSQIHIGGNQRFEAPSGDFKGCIHEVELWPSELRADQVASLVYDAHAYSQCYSNSAPYPGDRLDNPIFGSGGFAGSMTGAQCAERCNDPTNTDAYGRRCVAYEHSSQNHEDVANCAFAWACDYTGYWAGGATYVRRRTTDAPSSFPSKFPTANPTSSMPSKNLFTSSPSTSPSAGDFIIKFKGFHGNPGDFIDWDLASRDQPRMEAYQFDLIRQLKRAYSKTDFARGEPGVDACPTGYEPIMDARACAAGANAFGLTYDASWNDGNDDSVCVYCGECDSGIVRITTTPGPAADYICLSQGREHAGSHRNLKF